MSNLTNSYRVSSKVLQRSIFEIPSDENCSKKIKNTVDIWDIKKVPSNFESVSKPSKVVEQLLEKKKKLNAEILNEMRKKLIDIQEECADEITNHCHYIKMMIKNIRKEICDIQEEFKNDLARYSDEGCKTVRKILMTQLDRETNAIGEFHLRLKNVERIRFEHVKEMIIKYQELLNKIGFISFENSMIISSDEVQEYNQIILKNHKAYETLVFNLRLVTYEFKNQLNDWIEKIRIWHIKS